MSDPLDEILEAAGIPRDHLTRAVIDRGTHRVVTPIVEPRRIVLHHTTGQNMLDDLQRWRRAWLNVWLPDPTRFTRNDPPT